MYECPKINPFIRVSCTIITLNTVIVLGDMKAADTCSTERVKSTQKYLKNCIFKVSLLKSILIIVALYTSFGNSTQYDLVMDFLHV